MLKEFLLYLKYPYTAGIIACIWVGSAVMLWLDPKLPVALILSVNAVATLLLALVGFRGKN